MDAGVGMPGQGLAWKRLETVGQADSGLSKREWAELMALLGRET